MAKEVRIVIDGPRLSFVWDDEVADLLELGTPTIRRASHVEPTEDGRWTADMAPVDGPLLGPFKLRGDALAAECAWLADHGY